MSDVGFIPDDKLPRYTPDKLWTVRKRELGLTQEQLAEKANCDPKTVQRYESGESSIPPELIRTVERLRVEERKRRALEVGADQIDFSSANTAGLKLIELLPNAHVRELLGKLARMFVAVPEEWLVPNEEGGQPSSAPEPGPSPSRRRRRKAASARRAEFRMLAAGMTGLACLCGLILGTVISLRSELQTAFRPARSLRAARDAKVERPAAPPAAAREQPAPDATDEQRDDASAESEPLQVPEQIYTDKAKEEVGAGAKTKRSIKMRDKPYAWQKVAPCDPGEVEKVGGCWMQIISPPPCPKAAVESAGECYVPTPAEPAKPNTVTPVK